MFYKLLTTKFIALFIVSSIHIWVTTFAWQTAGWIAGLLSFFGLFFAEIYWAYIVFQDAGINLFVVLSLSSIVIFGISEAFSQTVVSKLLYFEAWDDPETDYTLPFDFQKHHLALLREMRFSWGDAETGAPRVDQNKPYGSKNILKDLKKIVGTDDQAKLIQTHLDSLEALRILLVYGNLKAGTYKINNLSAADIRKEFIGLPAIEINRKTGLPENMDSSGYFTFTDEHRKLLSMSIANWPYSYNVEGNYPTPEIDPKRPYSEGYPPSAAVAEDLGWPTTVGEEKYYPEFISSEQETRLWALHWAMLPAIQVFVENASTEFKEYE